MSYQSISSPSPVNAVMAKLESLRKELETAKVRLGFIGESGSGKSSLINAIVGRRVFEVGSSQETTREPQELEVDGLILVDLPGCGTPNFPKDRYIERFKLLKGYDGFVLVTASRVKEADHLLFGRLYEEARKPFLVARSHFDEVVGEKAEVQARSDCEDYIRRTLGASSSFPVYMVCSPGANHYDLEKLILALRGAISDQAKKRRFTMVAHAYGEATLREKRAAAEYMVGIYAGLAALNGLNPVPGLDVTLDVVCLKQMSSQIISMYGLSEEQIQFLQNSAYKGVVVSKGLHEIGKRFTPYLTERLLTVVLQRMGKEVAVKNAVKWVPFVGSIVSAALGFTLTYRLGEDLIDKAEGAAREIIQALAEQEGQESSLKRSH